MSEAPARRIGSFSLLGKLARSGLSELFLARSVGPRGFERLVVIKRLMPRYATSSKSVRAFIEEAKLAAQLEHPNIATVHELHLSGEACFLVMEHVHGQSVYGLLQRTARLQRALPIEHAVMIARCAASALHHAHERRGADGAPLEILHRDVSPHNILVTYEGVVKVIDFGAACATTRSIDTRTGTLNEKVAYLAPEQALGLRVDRRSDVYALGAVLWEALTGERFAKLRDDLETLEAIVRTPPRPPSQLRVDCPPAIERIVLKALAVDVEARFQTAEQLELALEDAARELRMRQSPVALRTHVQQLFAAEIISWKALQNVQPTGELTAAIAVETDAAAGVLEVAGTLDEPDDREDDDDSIVDEETSHFEPIENEDTDFTQVEALAAMAPREDAFEPIGVPAGALDSLVGGSIETRDEPPPLGPPPGMLVAPPMMPPSQRPPYAVLPANPTPEMFPVAPMEWTALARPVRPPVPYFRLVAIAAAFVSLFVIAFIVALLV